MIKNKIISTTKNIYQILSRRKKNQSLLLILFSIVNGFLESISIGLVLVYGNIILFPEKIITYTNTYSKYLDLTSYINNNNFLLQLTIFFISVIIIAALLKLLFGYFQTRIVNGFFYDLNLLFYKSILKKKYKDLENFNPNEILAILGKLNTVISVSTSIVSLITSVIIFIFIFTAMSLINFKLILLSSLFLMLFYLLIIKLTSKKLDLISKTEAFFEGKALELVNISIKSFKDITLYNSKKYFINNFSKLINRVCKIRIIAFIITDTPKNIVVPGILVILIIFTYNYSQSNNVALLLPQIAALVFSIQRMMPVINQIFNSYLSIRGAYESTNDVFNFIKENDISESDKKKVLPIEHNIKSKINFEKFIELKKLSFSYNKKNKIISELSLKIIKGEKIAITGKNGSGKSTLMNILMGFYEQYNGKIIIDETELNQSKLEDWQSKISYVPQKLFLFDNTIKNNITLGQDDLSFDKVKFNKAVLIARLNEFVDDLDEKYETITKDDGVRFSGGQIQKISLARAIYFSKEILFLDEFTSQIDKDSELKIIQDLFLEFKDTTIILITHNEKIKNLCREINLNN